MAAVDLSALEGALTDDVDVSLRIDWIEDDDGIEGFEVSLSRKHDQGIVVIVWADGGIVRVKNDDDETSYPTPAKETPTQLARAIVRLLKGGKR